MNSGVRLSVAILILITVLVGLYYARLGDDADLEPQTETPVPEVETESAPAIFREPELIAEPPIETEELAASEWTPEDEVATSDEESFAESEPEEEFSEFALNTEDFEALASAEGAESLDGDQLSDPAPETDRTEVIENDLPAATDGSDEPIVETLPSDSPDGGELEEIDAAVPTEPATLAGRSSRPGRSIEAAGVGAHRLAGDSVSAAEAEAARVVLAGAAADRMVVPVGDGLVWVAAPEGLDDAVLSKAVAGTSSDGGRSFLLIREDADGSMMMTGRVERADVTSRPASGQHDILIRVDGSQTEAIRDSSRSFVGHPLAWIVDGRLVAIQTLRIPISGRAKITLATDEDSAVQFASRLMSATAATPIERERSAPPASTGVTPGRVFTGGGERPAGPGELPPDMYELYQVKSGDTPSSIAAFWFGDANKVSLVLKANPNLDPTQLQIGDTLRLPPKDFQLWTVVASPEDGKPRIHIVQSGETLSHIAQAAYGQGSRWTEIYEANKTLIGADPKNLKVGMELRIP